MDIRARLYPYPVLSADNDDYVDSELSFEVKAKQQVREIELDISLVLKNDELQDMIDRDKAEFLVHIECSKTCYREVVRTSNTNLKMNIADRKLNGRVSICLFIVASHSIEGYTNSHFNEDYAGMNFDIERGGILAVGGQVNIQVTKEAEELSKVPSIFTICRSATQSEDDSMQINLDRDKIIITLCDDSFKNYKILCNNTSKLPIFHAMVIIPALIYALECIRKDGIETYENRRWFKAIRRTLANYGIELNKEILEMKPSYMLAQKLMDVPVNKAFVSALAEQDEEEDV